MSSIRCPTCSHGQGVDAEGRCLFRFVAADPSQAVDTSPATRCRCFCPRTIGERIVRAHLVFASYDKPMREPGQGLAATIDQALRNERERLWQPIETAPRDGTPILVAFPNGHVQQHVLKPAHVKVVWLDSDPPDRWMPLPVAAIRKDD